MHFLLFLLVLSFSLNCWALDIQSSAFDEGGVIPVKYTCDSLNYSPPLSWGDIPEGTKSFVIICDDPDAPFKTWVHWVIFNIPADKTTLEENVSNEKVLSFGAVQGVNDFGEIGYGGPCPPPGRPHRYFFKIYALSKMLDLESGATKEEIVRAMQGSILDEAKIVGFYGR